MANLSLSQQDIDYIAAVVDTEVNPSYAKTHPAEYAAMVEAVVDTITNRAASKGFPNTIAGVINAPAQFSAINGPRNRDYPVYGSIQNAPAARPETKALVQSHLDARAHGKPSIVGSRVNYANVHASDPKNVAGWIEDMPDKKNFGIPGTKHTHVHGTAPGNKAPPAYSITTPGFIGNPTQMASRGFGFSVSPAQAAIANTLAVIDGVSRPSYSFANRGFAPVATPAPSPRGANSSLATAPSASRGYAGPNSVAASLANAEWAGTNLSGMNFGLPPSYTSQVAQQSRAINPTQAYGQMSRGLSSQGITSLAGSRPAPAAPAPSPSPAALATVAPSVSPSRGAMSALGRAAPAIGSLASSALAAAPVGAPASGLAAASRGLGVTAPNAITAQPVAPAAPALPEYSVSRRSGIAKTDEQVREEGRARSRATMNQGRNAQRGTTPEQEKSIEAEISRQTALTPNHVYTGITAPGRGRFGVPSLGTVTGGLLGSMVAGPIGGLIGAVLGSRGLPGIGGAIGGNNAPDNSGAFPVANPSGGRGMLDVSGGPVSMGSVTATPTPSSGGYRGYDANTGWSSYTSPKGITTTSIGDGMSVGGPGLSAAVGGNSPGGKG